MFGTKPNIAKHILACTLCVPQRGQMTKPLTAAAVAKFRPGRKRRRIRDLGARSLFLIIEPSGHKSWQMRFRTPSGRIGKMTLGTVDLSGQEVKGDPKIGQPLTLAAARLLAAEVHRERALGHDPVADHKARKHRQRTEIAEGNASSFAAVARQFIEEHARPHTRRWQETARMLGYQPEDLSLIPDSLAVRWGDRPVGKIDSHDVWSVVDEARRLGVPGREVRNPGLSEARGRALLAILSSLFGWLQRQRRVTANPCAGIHHPPASKPRDRVLSSDELRWFWLACDGINEPFRSIFRLLALTGQRLNEVAGMRREELRDDGTWHLPGSRTKNRLSHLVPLPALARSIIAGMPAGQTQFIFTTSAGRPPTSWSGPKATLDAAMLTLARERDPDAVLEPWRLHDLRRSFVTGLVEIGVPPHVVEQIVNHVSGSRAGVAGVYDKSQLLPERRTALERWAAQVEGVVSGAPSKVVPFIAKGSAI